MNSELSADPAANTRDIGAAPHRRQRARLLWIAAAALVLILLALIPPLLKLNRYARGIALSMSQSLGRPVHLDNVSLGLFPVPHLTLQNVVVSEDPAFGSEPIIRANIVEANLRLSSLWHRPMEFSRVRFVEPSVNLVRNAAGRWNLEGVLVHASQVDTAPTAQQHRGPAPRFPYIEATGGRVNLKMGEEKKPFSLTDTDFALWLPSPEQWSVRLTGTPARTDTNLNDPGVIRLEGSLQRAAHMDQVPVTLHAAWRNAPLGEATRLLTGIDKGWRGTVQVDASIKGSLGAARLATEVTLDDLRRADFVPSGTLSLHLRCVALANVPAATLQDLSCNLPDGATQPLRIQAETLDLANPFAGSATLQAEAAPLEWFATWARLLSARFPPTALPGTLDATLSRGDLPASSAPAGSLAGKLGAPANTDVAKPAGLGSEAVLSGWLGTLTLHLPQPPAAPAPNAASRPEVPRTVGALTPRPLPSSQTFTAEVVPGPNGDSWRLQLAPSPLRLSPESTVSVSGTASPAGYSLHLAGDVPPSTLLHFATRVPPLADNLPAALRLVSPGTTTGSRSAPSSVVQTAATPVPLASPDAPTHVDLTCSRAWTSKDQASASKDQTGASGDQTCTRSADVPRKPASRSRR